MKIQHLILPAAAIGAAVALFLPAPTEAFTTIGGNLSTAQRDFRLFNNFTDTQANDNQVADANWPGWQGAYMSIWKACVEWNSVLHGGTGAGDPQQPNGVGSGGANFDAVWAGAANAVGTTNDNIHSEIPGSSGGVLAFTETPISDGWRIRYYQGWTWHDGPGTATGGGSNIDLQGVAAHEYGHALGLGHTGVAGSTMTPSISGNGSAARSIEADDKAGVQFIYGLMLGTKPLITGVGVSLGSVTITGQNFGATGNQVWFTSNVPTAPAGDPVVKVLNVSSNGTQITVPIPANAGAGDIFVKLATAGHPTLSNGFPFDPNSGPPCGSPSNFCIAAANSVGPGAVTSFAGSTSIANNDLQLIATGCPANKLGLFFYGMDFTGFTSFGNGFRCINSPFFRLPSSTSNAFGDFMFSLNVNSLPPGGQILAGQTWGFQLWYRDPDAGGANYNASDGLAVPFCP